MTPKRPEATCRTRERREGPVVLPEEGATLAREKPAPQVLLQHAYLLADGCRRYRKLVGGAHVTTEPRCGFERPQRIEMGQARRHK